MNKFLLLFLILCATGIITLFIYKLYFSKAAVAVTSQIELPQQYKSYKNVSIDFASEKYETVLLFNSENYFAPRPIRLYNSVNNEVIAEIDRDEKEHEPGKHYYRLDATGNKIDSLYIPSVWKNRDRGFIAEYMVNITTDKNYFYTTWPLNGDTTQKKINIINKDLSWNEDQVQDYYNSITADAKYIFYDSIEQNDGNVDTWQLNKTFFFKDKKWSVLYRKMKKHTRFDTTVHSYTKAFYYTSDDRNPGDADSQKNYQVRYFHKQNYISYEHSIGGGSQSHSKKGWSGTLYFDVLINGDSLHLKQDRIIVETENDGKDYYYRSNGDGESVSSFRLNIYTSEKLKYALFSNSLYRLYRIKAKAAKKISP